MSVLEIKNLSFHKIKSFNLRLQTGENIGFYGPSGGGKSLFLRAIADLDPVKGEFFLNGRNRNEYNPADWRQTVGFLPSESQWWYDKVGDHFKQNNIQWASDLGFEKDVLTWQISRLSSGEKQRLGLLRLLNNHPKVLLLDEPTANLDEQNTHRVEKLIHTYQQKNNAGVMWVSHSRKQLERISNRVFRIGDGEITRDIRITK